MSKVTTTRHLACDILVAGGGPAGMPCALAAARAGAKVVLCQDRPVLGGNASSEVRMHIVGADQHGARGKERDVETREGGIIEEIRLATAVANPQRSATVLDLVMYDLCRVEPNLTLMLNTTVTGAEMDGDRIAAAIAERPSTEDLFRITAQVFVDCTGDGRLGAEAGAAFRRGRESKAEFGEEHGQDVADGYTLGSSLMFTARKHDRPMPFKAPSWARKVTAEDLRHRWKFTPGVEPAMEYGFWWLEWGGKLDTIKDNEAIRDELLAILLGVWDFVKNGPAGTPEGADPHGVANWAMDWFGFLPGKRESRRFVGQYTLNENDVFESRRFDDAIAYGGWKIDLHPPEGVDDPTIPPYTPFKVPHVYDIPLRACVSGNVRNLMFAGRNMSATHAAFASTRVMATCAVVGQGVGTAAALGLRKGKLPAELAGDAAMVREIQQRLLRDDCYLIGVLNEDEADLARGARVTASSEQPDGEAAHVLSGQTRTVHGKGGAPPDRAHRGTHRWMSDPSKGLPAWIELRWDGAVAAGSVQLVWDTGMGRELMLTPSDAHTAWQGYWGRPQPETARDYVIEGCVNGTWRTLATVTGNYQRLCRHVLPEGTRVEALRVTVTATQGVDHARLMEVRVYG